MKNNGILTALRNAGHRVTPQRKLILAALSNKCSHMDVKEIHEAVAKTWPPIDIATIYRTLQLLGKLHLVTVIDKANVTAYELLPQTKRHHHAVCEHCKSTFELPPIYLENLRQQLISEVSFEPHLEHFTINGLCASCRKQESTYGQPS